MKGNNTDLPSVPDRPAKSLPALIWHGIAIPRAAQTEVSHRHPHLPQLIRCRSGQQPAIIDFACLAMLEKPPVCSPTASPVAD